MRRGVTIEGHRFNEGGLAFFLAGFLHGFQFPLHTLELVQRALFIETDEPGTVGVAIEGFRNFDRVLDLRMTASHEMGWLPGKGECETVRDGRAGLVEPSVVFGDGAGELDFFETFRVEGGCELAAEVFGGEAFFVGQDCDLGGDFVAKGVEAGCGFAFFGLWAGRALGVAAIGFNGAL
jgi:hypothetical protein